MPTKKQTKLCTNAGNIIEKVYGWDKSSDVILVWLSDAREPGRYGNFMRAISIHDIAPPTDGRTTEEVLRKRARDIINEDTTISSVR